MSRMNKTDLEIIRFDTTDVILTSGGLDIDPNLDDVSVALLWLDVPSINNYNAFSDSDIDLDIDNDSDFYFGYSGKYHSKRQVYIAADAKASGNPPTHLNTMADGDAAMYDLINAWLLANKK